MQLKRRVPKAIQAHGPPAPTRDPDMSLSRRTLLSAMAFGLTGLAASTALAQVKELRLEHIQLALGELLFLDDKRKHFELLLHHSPVRGDDRM